MRRLWREGKRSGREVGRDQVEMWLERRSRVWRDWERLVGVVLVVGGWGEDEVILLAFRRRVWRFGRVRRGVREVRVGSWFPERSIEWIAWGRLMVGECDSQASSSLLAKMRVCKDGNGFVIAATSSGERSVAVRPKYRMLGN